MHTKSDTPLIADETRDSEDSESWPRPAFANARKSRRRTYLFQAALATLCLLLSAVTCYLGYRLGLQQAPRLPTHSITGEGFRQRLQTLDDEFEVRDPSNLKFKGLPRPELDEAWEGLLKGMNIRVHPAEAKRANFTSIELADNSGDVYGMPTVFHNLHCLALMCHGDMSLYRFSWLPDQEKPKPLAHMPHICVDWNKMQSWAVERSFSMKEGLLRHPGSLS
ncbi:hypothetical protein EsH8_V_000948 [Colletotrichum jinshuiense]